MSGEDIKAIVAAHKANPRQVTTMAVAFCFQRYKAQVGEVLRPSDLVLALGISDSMARRAVRAVREMASPDLDSDPGTATFRNGDVPPEPQRSGTATFREPEPQRSADRNGDVPHTNDREKDREEIGGRSSRTHAREGTGPDPAPDPEAEAERERLASEARRLADELTAGALGRWASDACRVYPPHHVLALVQAKLPGARPLPRVEWLNAILRRWARGEGADIPPDPSAKPPAVVPYRATGTDHRPRRGIPDFASMDFGD